MISVERLHPRRVAASARRRWRVRRDLWPPPWKTLPPPAAGQVQCNICRWEGPAFEPPQHVEGATCPRCGSIARDRFLHLAHGWQRRLKRGQRILETSPRLGDEYRTWMAHRFHYTSSDYDESAHRGAVRLDLQDIDLPSASVDAVLTPHVLEHVPDTDAALRELRRILAPGGRLVLQVPVLQAVTAAPVEPEFHGDNTVVFWRFGYDLTDRLRAQDWAVHALCTEDWVSALRTGARPWPEPPVATFDVEGMLRGAEGRDFEAAVTRADAARFGLEPAYQLLTWVCDVPPRR
jgi:SAM-dependent methyltransferase